jgi:hypothetical protein
MELAVGFEPTKHKATVYKTVPVDRLGTPALFIKEFDTIYKNKSNFKNLFLFFVLPQGFEPRTYSV